LLQVKKNELTISATDLYVGVKASVPISSSEDGEIAVPAKQFKQIVSTSPREELTIETKDDSCAVSSTHSKAELLSMMGEEFPTFPSISAPTRNLQAKEIQKISKWVLPSASTDPTRPILTTVLLRSTPQYVEAVCTDGFRLAMLQIPQQGKLEQTLLLPARALRDIARITEDEKVESIELSVDQDQKQSVISVGDYQYYLRVVEGEFPPYQKILPEETLTSVVFDKAELLENLQRAMVFNQDNSYIANFVIEEKAVKIGSTSPSVGVFEAQLVLAKVVGQVGSIAFNTRYILDLLQELPDETVEFGMKDSLKPAWFKAPSEPSFLYVIMPFRINS